MKHDGDRAVIWAKLHWQIAKAVCVCIPILAMLLADIGFITDGAAFIAAVGSVAYVMLLTWNYTRGNGEKPT